MEVNKHYTCMLEEMCTGLGIANMKPRYPQYSVITKRHDSFSTWPQHLPVSADELADCGFVYTGVDDSVRCYYCGGGLKNWEAGDDPWVEHVTWYPECPHVLLSKGRAFVDRFRDADNLDSDGRLGAESAHQTHSGCLETTAAQSCIQMGYSEDNVRLAIERYISVHGDSNFKGQDLCEILLDAEEEEESRGSTNVTDCVSAPARTADTTALTQSAHATAGTETAHATVGTGPEHDSDNRSMEELYEENQRLKDNQLCKICLDGPASIIFLPCGHMVTCPQCAPAFSTCPICRLRVHGFVKAYFVSS